MDAKSKNCHRQRFVGTNSIVTTMVVQWFEHIACKRFDENCIWKLYMKTVYTVGIMKQYLTHVVCDKTR